MIGSCDNCGKNDVPVFSGAACGCETTQCYLCNGDVADPYGELEEARPTDTDTDAVLSSLKHDASWLIEISNSDPRSFVGREQELYSILNALQLVTSRFARVA